MAKKNLASPIAYWFSLCANYKMRIERFGPVRRLTPRVVEFFTRAMGATRLDDILPSTRERADYSCLNGLVAIELKSLEDDGSERLENLNGRLEQLPDWPQFLGSWPVESVLKNLPNRDEIEAQLCEQISRGCINHLKKADDQLAAHAKDFPRKNLVRIVWIANEDHAIYDPNIVRDAVRRFLSQEKNGAIRYGHIDAVIFVSERHATKFGGKIAFPIVIEMGASVTTDTWKHDVVMSIVGRWATWAKRNLLNDVDGVVPFFAVDHVPERLRRYEIWELEYKRNPYMYTISDEELRERWDACMILCYLAFLKSSPQKLRRDECIACMRQFSHVLQELGRRGLPITRFEPSLERYKQAARRLGLPAHIDVWLESIWRERPSGARPTRGSYSLSPC